MSDPNFSAIRARLKYASIDSFVDGYSRFISSGGMFIPMAAEKLKPIGTTIRFQFLLNDGTTALLGEGTVLQVRPPDDDKPNAPVGMLVKFAKLSQESKTLVDLIVQEKEAAAIEPEPEPEVEPQRDPTAASDDPTGQFSQDELQDMHAAEVARQAEDDDPATREAPSAADLTPEEDDIALELERVDEEVRQEGGPKRLAGTDGGISVFAFDEMSDEDMKDFENFSFGGDEDEIDSMFDGLFGGGDDGGDGLFGGGGGDGLFGGGGDEGDDFFGSTGDEDDDVDFFAGNDEVDEDPFAAAAPAEQAPDESIEPEPEFELEAEPAPDPEPEPVFEEPDFELEEDSEPEVNLEPEMGLEAEPFAEPEPEPIFDEESDPFADDFDSPSTEIGRPLSAAEEAADAAEANEDDDELELDFPEFDKSAPEPEPAFDEPHEVPDEGDAFLQDDDDIDFPMADSGDESSAIELDSDASFVEEIIEDEDDELFAEEPEDAHPEQESGVYDLIGSFDDEDEPGEMSLNIGHGALAQQPEEPPEPEEDEDEESLEALLASAQKEIASKQTDEEKAPEGDIIDQLLGDDDELPPPPSDMPAFQLPDGNSKKKKKGGFISKLFGKD